MTTLASRLVLANLFLGCLSVSGGAQVPQGMRPVGGAGEVLYRLDLETTYSRGCYPPCDCLLVTTEDVYGTFTLRFEGSDVRGLRHYRVGAVNWIVTLEGEDHRVTGGGTYVVGGELALTQRLELDLALDADPAQHFDSGPIVGGSGFPGIDIAVSVNGMYCYDEVYEIVASPVPAGEVRPYSVGGTSYEEGCFPPCRCMIRDWPVDGAYGLVPLSAFDPEWQHFGLVHVRWSTLPSNPSDPPDRRFRGFGIYSRSPALGLQRLAADLTDQDEITRRFDSGVVTGGGGFPSIDADLSVGGFYCFDYAFLLRSRPR